MCSYAYLKISKNEVEIWNCHLFNRHRWRLSIFIDFRVPPTTPWSMILPQALFFSKNTPLEFWSMYLMDFVIFLAILGSPGEIFKIWIIWSNDYASKTRIKILCKKTCWIAPHLFSQPDLLCNSWKYRTLARMSTLTLKGPTGGSLGLNLSGI